ncbi:MAG: GNAT family N-acetyltransferase [Phaeodactylibacter sp.]|nr:GNAT family N-acetyltransferase [Phaeodactylibacter sp.]
MTGKYILETPRLLLREFAEDDAPHFFELNEDPEVVRYTGDPPFASIEEARQFLSDYDQYEKYGYGRWAVLLKAESAGSGPSWIGWCGLKYIPELDETDIGFRFFRRYWGRGYATEAARACLEYGFRELRLKRIVGRVMKENTASVRVLEKIGLEFWKEFDFMEHPGLYFRKDAPGGQTESGS